MPASFHSRPFFQRPKTFATCRAVTLSLEIFKSARLNCCSSAVICTSAVRHLRRCGCSIAVDANSDESDAGVF